MHIPHRLALFAAMALSASLAACGGGGSGSAVPATTASSTSNATNTAQATGTLASPQYASGSAELAAFHQLNTMRQECGFPQLTENTLLDTAAQNHMAYMQDNLYEGHYETAGNPGFTGTTPSARGVEVGCGPTVGEVIAFRNTDSGGADGVLSLSLAPYHAAGLFMPYSNVGMAYAPLQMGPTGTVYSLLMDMGATTGMSYAQAPLTYPCQGVADAPYAYTSAEDPHPIIQGVPVIFPIGTPIIVAGGYSDTLTLTSGIIIDPQGHQTTLDLLDADTDSNGVMPAYSAVAIPPSPLEPNTTYTVNLAGTVNGAAFTRDFTFTTGSQSF